MTTDATELVTLTQAALDTLLEDAVQRGRLAQLTREERTSLAAVYGYEAGLADGWDEGWNTHNRWVAGHREGQQPQNPHRGDRR